MDRIGRMVRLLRPRLVSLPLVASLASFEPCAARGHIVGSFSLTEVDSSCASRIERAGRIEIALWEGSRERTYRVERGSDRWEIRDGDLVIERDEAGRVLEGDVLWIRIGTTDQRGRGALLGAIGGLVAGAFLFPTGGGGGWNLPWLAAAGGMLLVSGTGAFLGGIIGGSADRWELCYERKGP